ncbi:class F sortase [Candidatus Wolfebacteria bacterium]|nr:class F sortase [Candidatus Wolfebacteria bacterium]
MLSKILIKRILLIFIFSGLTLFIALLLYFFLKNPIQNGLTLNIKNTAILSNQKQIDIGLPIRLKIPSIKVNAPIEYVGLTSDGAMDVPKGPNETVWLDIGPRPGEKGSSVIAGHYGWKNNIPAVFDNLHKLRAGDEVFIEDEKKLIITFIVREIKIYEKDETVLEVFNLNDEKSHLNLITCMGNWNIEEKTRSKRLVVFTDKK